MSKEPPKMPPNRGRIVVAQDNTSELRFWIRVFELDAQIAQAEARFKAHNELHGESAAAWACVPIISEYVSGALTWLYVLVIDIDLLGVTGGTGLIFYADAENCAAARQSRDKFANHIIATLAERTEAEISRIEISGPGHQE